MIVNRVKELYRQGRPSFGTYITIQSPLAVEAAASAGMDFVRIDSYKHRFNPETLDNMIRTALSYGVTPWVRCRNDPWDIMQALDNGALVVSMKVNSVEDARSAVASTFYPPRGVREPSRAKRHKSMPEGEYLDWYNDQVLISLQLESPGALEHYREIVKVEGAECIQFGKHGIAAALGVPLDKAGYGPTMDPRVEEMEKRIVSAALEAGKQVSLVHALTPDGIERTKRWIEQGVYVMCLDSDFVILNRDYTAGLKALRGTDDQLEARSVHVG